MNRLALVHLCHPPLRPRRSRATVAPRGVASGLSANVIELGEISLTDRGSPTRKMRVNLMTTDRLTGGSRKISLRTAVRHLLCGHACSFDQNRPFFDFTHDKLLQVVR
jgi:hypothetical protein